MQDTTPPIDKGMNWKLFFLSGLLLILPTCYVFYYISPIGNLPVLASDPNGQGAGVDQLIIFVHILMGALFVGWIGYFIYVLFRYHKSRNPRADYTGVTSHASTYLEGVVALIEAVLLIGFAIPIWAHAVDQFPKEKDSTVIKVIGQQFQWNGWYPDTNGVFATNNLKFVSGDNPFGLDKNDPHYKQNFIVSKDLVVPVNKPVIVYISSLDVIHCFAVKPMRVTQDAIPGMVIPAHFTPVKLGTYRINCAQLCGAGHYSMGGTLKVVSAEDYQKWAAAKSSAGAGAGAGFE
jgi:cytochrome c oxidase subunit II